MVADLLGIGNKILRTKLESHRVAIDCFLKFLMLNHLDILAHQNLDDVKS